MCDCITRLNEHLKPHNTRLTEVSMFNMKTGTCRQSLTIGSQKIGRSRAKAKVVLPTFCPFCGERVAPKDDDDGPQHPSPEKTP